MKLTSKQKKTWLPLLIMLLSFIIFVTMLGDLIAVVAWLVFIAATGAFMGWNAERLFKEFNEWANKDDE